MKRLFTIVALLCAASAIYAQDIFVGGNLSYSSEKVQGEDRSSVFEIAPEIGYTFSEHGSFILGLGYASNDSISGIALTPYYEHALPLTDKLSFNLDLGLEFAREFGESNTFSVWGGIGLEYMLNGHWSTSLNADVFEFGKTFADGDKPDESFSSFSLFRQPSVSVGFNYYF